MLQITNTNEMNTALIGAENEPLQFPSNVNVLLGYEQNEDTINQLEEVGATSRRSVHLYMSCGFGRKTLQSA